MMRKKKKELKSHRLRLQDVLLSSDVILKKVFRKDGPPLGVEFDSLPSQAFRHCEKGRLGSKISHRSCQETQRALKGNKASRKRNHVCDEKQRLLKRRKVSKHYLLDYQVCNKKSAPVKKHGIGKGLMTVWRAINPDGGDFPTGVNFGERDSTAVFQMSTLASQKTLTQEKTSRKRQPVTRRIGKGTKVQDKRKPPVLRRKVEVTDNGKQKQPRREKCELALEGVTCEEDLGRYALLMDDEVLELRELQAGPNPLTCSAHLGINGLHGCSLCKGLLDKFPPNSVMMRLLFYMQPWVSSPDLVKKLFKIFQFLYTYGVMFSTCSFTIDEFAQAFVDKESMLLGNIHLALLKLLLSDVEKELSRGFFPHASKNGKLLELLNSVEHRQYLLELWLKSLNPLTWTEIMRQVFVAAGFGSKYSKLQNEALNKEVNLMIQYGLTPDTLKGELFSILSEQGNNGIKVSDLAKYSTIVDLNLTATTDELELLISSTLSSDITLFEKISCSAYRLRILSVTKEAEDFELDPGDCGSLDEESKDTDSYSSGDDSGSDSGKSALSRLKQGGNHKKGNNMLTVYTEIDESHPGEAWLLGLMEGEYSDLSIEEKLNALMALVDLLTVGSSIRIEDPISPIVECGLNSNHYGSGGKIKRSSVNQHNMHPPVGCHVGQMLATKEFGGTSRLHPDDSLASISKFCAKTNSGGQRKNTKEMEIEYDLHPMQSVFLGSDRRYNRYWLFLGPCNSYDPGHKRIYFESSEDGHWEVIDTEEAVCTLLSALDRRGKRESHLLVSLKKREAFLCQAMSSMLNDDGIRQLAYSDQSELSVSREDSTSAVSDVDNNLCLNEIRKDFSAPSGVVVPEIRNKEEQQKQKWGHLQAFDAWIWRSFYNDLNAVKHSKRSYLDSLTRCECCHDLYWRDEKHCKTCHATFELDFDLEERYAIHVATCQENGKANMFPKHKVLPSQLQVVKAAIHAIESVMPKGSLVGAWTKSAHRLWIKRLRRTSTLTEVLQVLADFVDAINEDWLCQFDVAWGSDSVVAEIIASFTTMPQTLSAVALWLVKLDALIALHFVRVLAEE